MFVRALAQVHRSQVKSKHVNRANQRVQSLRNQCLTVVGNQRRLDGVQISQKLFRLCISILRGNRVPRGVAAGQALQSSRQAGIHAGEGAAVGFVLPMLVGVRRAVGKQLHGRADAGQHRRHRQFTAEQMDFS